MFDQTGTAAGRGVVYVVADIDVRFPYNQYTHNPWGRLAVVRL